MLVEGERMVATLHSVNAGMGDRARHAPTLPDISALDERMGPVAAKRLEQIPKGDLATVHMTPDNLLYPP